MNAPGTCILLGFITFTQISYFSYPSQINFQVFVTQYGLRVIFYDTWQVYFNMFLPNAMYFKDLGLPAILLSTT